MYPKTVGNLYTAIPAAAAANANKAAKLAKNTAANNASAAWRLGNKGPGPITGFYPERKNTPGTSNAAFIPRPPTGHTNPGWLTKLGEKLGMKARSSTRRHGSTRQRHTTRRRRMTRRN